MIDQPTKSQDIARAVREATLSWIANLPIEQTPLLAQIVQCMGDCIDQHINLDTAIDTLAYRFFEPFIQGKLPETDGAQ